MTFEPIAHPAVIVVLAVIGVAGIVAVLVRGDGNRRNWALRLSAVLLLVVAALRPGLPVGASEEVASAVDVFIAVDTSNSMVAEDWDGGEPRLKGVKDDIVELSGQLPGARFSLITFSQEAVNRMPLTTDTAALRSAVEIMETEPSLHASGSSITAAHDMLLDRLTKAEDSRPGHARLLYYFGDGEQTAADEPADMSDLAPLLHGGAVMGYGTAEGGRMKQRHAYYFDDPPVEYIRDPATQEDAVSVIDEENLSAIAEQLGVEFTVRDARSTIDAGMTPAQMKQITVQSNRDGGRTDLGWIAMIGVFAVVVLDTSIVLTAVRRLRRFDRAGAEVTA